MNCGLYLITPPVLSDDFASRLEGALRAGRNLKCFIAAIQLRLKPADRSALELATRSLMPIAHEYGAAFIINDVPHLAHDLGADGCHIGQADMGYHEARTILGDNAIIGVTCHNSRHLAMVAGEAGADYVAFGSFYSSTTKAVEHYASADILQWWQEIMEIPCVAIGGITPANASDLVLAGADFLAISSGIWSHPAGADAAIVAFSTELARVSKPAIKSGVFNG